MTPKSFLLLNLALAFYNVGTIWAHEVDIFRTWKLVDARNFLNIQSTHWKMLPYWVLTPIAFALVGGTAPIWRHPLGSPGWGYWGSWFCQVASITLTAIFWAPWQAKLSKDPLGPGSPYLQKILATHWVRTLFITAYAFILPAWTIRII